VRQLRQRSVDLLAVTDRKVAHRPWAIAQQLPARREAEAAALIAGHDAQAGKQAQQPMQRIGVRSDLLGELGAGPRAVGDAVGDSQLGGGVDRIGPEGPGKQVQQLVGGRALVRVHQLGGEGASRRSAMAWRRSTAASIGGSASIASAIRRAARR
jgi:hypothetical protein